MFAKSSDVENALRLFRNIPQRKRTIVSWTCVIFGMALHGRGVEAISLFEEMRGARVAPDNVAFLSLRTACNSDLVKEGKAYFDSVVTDYRIAPKMEHYGCMVDLLSRAGLVEEALEFINTMPVAPNPTIWRTLIALSHAQAHDLKLGERITTDLIKHEPMQEANYVVLSTIYAKKLDWENKSRVREAMRKKGMKKIPGSTMIEVGDGIYKFVAGKK